MEHEKEWWELHRNAYKVLEKSDVLPQRNFVERSFMPCFDLWRHPSFEAHFAWHVYRKDDGTQFGIERIIWDLPLDSVRFSNPLEGMKSGFSSKPTLRREVIYLAAELVVPTCQELQRLRVMPILGNSPWGFDGETCGIAVGDNFNKVCVTWWGDGPAEWRALAQWFTQTTTLLDAHFG